MGGFDRREDLIFLWFMVYYILSYTIHVLCLEQSGKLIFLCSASVSCAFFLLNHKPANQLSTAARTPETDLAAVNGSGTEPGFSY